MKESPAPKTSGFFDQKQADAYDERNSALAPIAGCLHFLTNLVLEGLPENARVLCVGVGTGAEILALADSHPGWSFVGVDPSAEMLNVGRRRLEQAGVLDRCELLQGYVDDVTETSFDAVVSLFVAHFIQREARAAFYRAIHQRLSPGGHFVSAEITGDLDAADFPAVVDDWKQVQRRMGAIAESLAKLPEMLRNVLGVLSPAETEALWRDAGFAQPIAFFQAFMIRGWHARR